MPHNYPRVIMANELYPKNEHEISLTELEKLIPKLKKRYGANAKLAINSGHENITLEVIPSKKLRTSCPNCEGLLSISRAGYCTVCCEYVV